jgi:tetrapyrrole methylase family protein/MazG family protein
VSAYLRDEVYEVLDAIRGGSPDDLQEELGDVLFQIIFLAALAEERGEFSLTEVIVGITEKMVRRHPHVFGNRRVKDVAEIKANWEEIKKYTENKPGRRHTLDGVPRSMPSLLRAQKITEKASRCGFDWENAAEVLTKVEEELGELKVALGSGQQQEVASEMGDVLFTLVNLCRFLKVDAEESLHRSVEKFIRRFAYIEDKLGSEGKTARTASCAEMERLWQEAKTKEDGT